MTLSFLRTTYPKVYDRIRIHRRSLVDAEGDPAQLRTAWSAEALAELEVEKAALGRVAAALARLFPRLSVPVLPADDARQRLAGKRVGDPDHVDRYFALTPTSDDLTDAVLTAGLTDLVGDRGSVAVQHLVSVLSPASNEQKNWDRAARLYRRASAQVERLPQERARELLLAALSVVPATVPPGVSLAPLSAAESWLTSLICLGGAPDQAELARAVARPAESPSPLATLISALEGAMAQAEDPSLGLAELAQHTAELAWQRFLGNVGHGDYAAQERTSLLLRWAQQHLPAARLADEIRSGIEGGLPVADLAARLVVIGRDGRGHDLAVGFQSEQAVALLGTRVSPKVAQALVRSGELPAGAENDVSWPNLRAFGGQALRRTLFTRTGDPETEVSPVDNPRLRSFRPGTVQRAIAGLHARANVRIPFGDDLPAASTSNDPAFELREALLLAAMGLAPITRWLKMAKLGIPVDWQLAPSIGRGNSACVIRMPAEPPDSPAAGVAVGAADLITELEVAPDRTPALILSVALNLPLEPLPLDTTFSLLMALLRQVDVARQLWRRLHAGLSEPPDVAVTMVLESGSPLESILDLQGLHRIGTGVAGVQLAESLRIVESQPQTGVGLEPLKDIAAAALGRWLQDAQYRNFAETISALKREHRPVRHRPL